MANNRSRRNYVAPNYPDPPTRGKQGSLSPVHCFISHRHKWSVTVVDCRLISEPREERDGDPLRLLILRGRRKYFDSLPFCRAIFVIKAISCLSGKRCNSRNIAQMRAESHHCQCTVGTPSSLTQSMY